MMKYCSKCGNELLDEAVICPQCGCAIEVQKEKNTRNSNSKIQTAFVLNVIALVIAIISIGLVSCMLMDMITIGSSSADEKTFMKMIEIKQEYEKAKSEEENYLNENKDDIEIQKYYELDLAKNIENIIKHDSLEAELVQARNRLVNRLGNEDLKIIKCIDLTMERAKAEKAYQEIENSFESTCTTLTIFGVLLLVVVISFILSIIVKIKLGKNSNKKTFAWIYFIFVILEDIIYAVCSFIIFVYVICGVGILLPVAPILQTIAAVKFLQATKE